jgi:hypothetical protein
MSHRSLVLALAAAIAVSTAGPAAEAGMVFVPVPKRPPGVKGTPMPSATPSPTPAPTDAPASGIPPGQIEFGVNTWMIPSLAGTADFDFSFTRPTWVVDAAYWRGRWGIGLEAIAFNTTYAPFRTAPYFVATTPMIEGQLRHRFSGTTLEALAGLRSLGQGDLVFGTLGGSWRQPFGETGAGLTLDGRAGHNIQNSYFVDASALVSYRFRGAQAELGFRQLVLQVSGDPVVLLSGPTAGFSLRF